MKYIKLFEISTKSQENDLIRASKRGSSKTVEDICKKNPNIINDADNILRTPLMWASLNNFLMVVKILIKYNADVNLRDLDGRTALMMASTPKIIDILLKSGANVNIQNNNGETIIMEYLKWTPTLLISIYSLDENLMIIYLKKFLEYGLDLSIKNNQGLNLFEKVKKEKEEIEDFERRGFSRSVSYNNLEKIEEYLIKYFPQYKEQWELDKAIKDFNL